MINDNDVLREINAIFIGNDQWLLRTVGCWTVEM